MLMPDTSFLLNVMIQCFQVFGLYYCNGVVICLFQNTYFFTSAGAKLTPPWMGIGDTLDTIMQYGAPPTTVQVDYT